MTWRGSTKLVYVYLDLVCFHLELLNSLFLHPEAKTNSIYFRLDILQSKPENVESHSPLSFGFWQILVCIALDVAHNFRIYLFVLALKNIR
jgi:hypothetical protein